MRLDEQTVLVTGGGRGLGAAIAAAFAGEGARVVIDYRTSKEAAEALADRLGDRAFAVQGDVTDESAVASVKIIPRILLDRNRPAVNGAKSRRGWLWAAQ